MNFIEELQWRGMLHDTTPSVESLLAKGPQVAYIGFDPTAPSLHIGSLATIHLLVHWARTGNKPVALLGGATGAIGDPSGKSAERNLLSQETLQANADAVAAQLKAIFAAYEVEITIVNNLDWVGKLSALEFLRDVGKMITISYMLAKDSVKSRLESGMSFTEFSYQLIQGYDFLQLFQTHQCTIQMGGSDQWGNMTTGMEMIRRQTGAEVGVVTTPLVTKADGSKFGKSEEGNVWLHAALTSPYKFYQFWLNISDQDAPKLIRVFTFLDKAAIETLETEHNTAPHLRLLQKRLAQEITTALHGKEAYDQAIQASMLLFGQSTWEEWIRLDDALLSDVLEGIPRYQVTVEPDMDLAALLSTGTGGALFTSRSEVRKLITAGGLSLNLTKVTGDELLSNLPTLAGGYVLGLKGKKNYFLLKIA
jgi:tyrosyl-tRNA synthetase